MPLHLYNDPDLGAGDPSFKRRGRKVPQKTYRLISFEVTGGLPAEALAKEGKGEMVV